MKHFIQYNAVLLAFFFGIASGSDVGAAVFGGIIHETPKKIIKAGGKPLKVIDGDSFFIGKDIFDFSSFAQFDADRKVARLRTVCG